VTSTQLQSQLEDQIQTKIYEAYAPVYEGRNAEIFFRGLNEPDSLNDVDSFTFDLLMRRHVGAITMTVRKVAGGELESLNQDYVVAHYQKVLFDKPGGARWLKANEDSLADAKGLFRFD